MLKKPEKNILFFITSSYPYGKSEIFIENEIKVLSEKFDKTIIFSGTFPNSNLRSVPNGVEVRNIPYDFPLSIIQIFLSIFSWAFFQELFIIVFLYYKLPTFGRIKTIAVSLSNANRLKVLYQKEISKFKKDYNIFMYSFWYNDSAIAISKIKEKSSELITVSRAHRWDLYFKENKYNYLPFRFQTSKNLDSIYSASVQGIKYCKEYWKISKYNNLRLSRLGVKNQNFLPQNKTVKIIVSCSNVINVKRVDKIISSLSLVKTKGLKWVHFGTGPEFAAIKKFAETKLKNKMNFEFLGHFKNPDLLNWYKLNNPSLFINLSRSEGIPVSIMEAMSFGIPCVVTKVGGSIELVPENIGFPLRKEVGNQEVASVIDKYFKLSLEEKTKIRNKSFDHINKEFNSDKNYKNFCEDLLSL